MSSLRNGSCAPLIDNSNESFYWIGFILADGYISEINRLKVALSIKDVEHLNKMANFLGTKVHIQKGEKYCYLAIQDKRNIEVLRNRYTISNNKTINPPAIEVFESLSYKQLLCVFTGFIDGDGSIRNLHKRKDFNLQIKVHHSWLRILNMFSLMFLKKERARLNKEGYAYLSCGDSVILKELKRQVLKLNIPTLNRKWDIVDLDFKGKYEKSLEDGETVIYMFKEGFKQKEIADLVKISQAAVSVIIKNYNI